MVDPEQKHITKKMINIKFKENIDLSPYTTIKVGGFSKYFYEPSNIAEFIEIVSRAKSQNLPCRIIGAGSNLLINNIEFNGLTICTRKMKTIKIDTKSGLIYAECGVMLPTLSRLLASNCFTGGEWIIGIPGTVGGGICMNAGTGKESISDNLLSVQVVDPNTLKVFEIEKKDMIFDYRFSPFLENSLIIISAKLIFKHKGDHKLISKNTKEIFQLKIERQPYHLPSFGSVFKNPQGLYAGKLIEDIGLKGFKIGGAEVSTMHANFIVNNSNATSEEIYELIILIQKKVLQNKGIFLKPEVRMIDF